MHDQLFASFILDEKNGLEIALKAENVTEATSLNSAIQQLPTAIDYLEGIMPLREDLIPVINLKKRLGLEESHYDASAKVAIVSMHNQQFGLLFDDIQEVFKADKEVIMPINSLLQTEDRIISAIIKLNQGKRTVELLDLGHLFKGQSFDMIDQVAGETGSVTPTEKTTYSRWVVFTCFGQLYAVPVKYSREIAFFSEIDDMFKSGNVEGAIQLRGSTIPVMNGRYLLSGKEEEFGEDNDNRVLILASEECSFGMMVDEINEIITLADDDILPVPSDGSNNLLGIYPQQDRSDILLLDMPNLICNQIEDIKSLARINNDSENIDIDPNNLTRSHHLITENCYLIFAIDKHFAIELKDVQEIIEGEDIMRVPRATGFGGAVINLRGEIVPVINTRQFYGFSQNKFSTSKLIICRGHSRIVALEVDHIVTIYKQEDYHSTPSLNSQLAEKKDTLDRLIEYENDAGLKEHVLVVNMHNLIRNHLEFKEETTTNLDDTENISEKVNS